MDNMFYIKSVYNWQLLNIYVFCYAYVFYSLLNIYYLSIRPLVLIIG